MVGDHVAAQRFIASILKIVLAAGGRQRQNGLFSFRRFVIVQGITVHDAQIVRLQNVIPIVYGDFFYALHIIKQFDLAVKMRGTALVASRSSINVGVSILRQFVIRIIFIQNVSFDLLQYLIRSHTKSR